ncbi:hypothetical protein [Rhodopila sp.]|uniref:hypothetical protein n=1 Tax=Rhodopila sp. TaxID=2480087 RepID=UPI003D100B19
MGRKWEITQSQYAWNFEQCEELLLIAGYEEIKPYIPFNENWVEEFENHFYRHGNGVAFRYVDEVNAVRRRRALPKLEFRETDVFDYGKSTNKLVKSEHRQRVRADLLAASVNIRSRLVSQALSEAKALPEPHQTFEEWKANRRRFANDAELSREEAARRFRAFEQVDGSVSSRQLNLAPDRAVTMLKYASSPELRQEIIGKLSPDGALAAVEQVDDADLRDALIRHSLT